MEGRGTTLRPVDGGSYDKSGNTLFSFVLPDKHPQPQHQLLLLLVIVTAIKQTCPRVSGSVGTFSFAFAQFFLTIHTHNHPPVILTLQSFTHQHTFVCGWCSMLPLTPKFNKLMATILYFLIYSLLKCDLIQSTTHSQNARHTCICS